MRITLRTHLGGACRDLALAHATVVRLGGGEGGVGEEIIAQTNYFALCATWRERGTRTRGGAGWVSFVHCPVCVETRAGRTLHA